MTLRRSLPGTSYLRLAAALSGFVLTTARFLDAQGFGLNDVGSCEVARAYAATGAPCHDASTIYWNPGAAATLPGLSIVAGGAPIAVNGGFTQDTSLRRFPGNVP